MMFQSQKSGRCGDNCSVLWLILPFLMEFGVVHTVAEIRRLSLKTVSEMIDSSGSLVHLHLSALIPCLLLATGELDNAKLNSGTKIATWCTIRNTRSC